MSNTKINDVKKNFTNEDQIFQHGNYIIDKEVKRRTPGKSRKAIFQYMSLFMELYSRDIDRIENKLHDYVIKVDTNMIDIIYLYLDIHKESLNDSIDIELSIAKDIYDNLALRYDDEDKEMKYVEYLDSSISQPLQVYVKLLKNINIRSSLEDISNIYSVVLEDVKKTIIYTTTEEYREAEKVMLEFL